MHFLDNTCKIKLYIELYILEIVLHQINPKGYIWYPKKSRNITIKFKSRKNEHHHWILYIRISLSTKFQLKLTVLLFLDQICPKKVFPSQNRKSEHHNWILHVRISRGTKFQLKLAILIFGTYLLKKSTSDLKHKNRTFFCCVHCLLLLLILNFSAWMPTNITVF